MSLNSDITRIKNAKAAIKTAVAAKGVDVGDGKLDTYAAKIGEIVTGENVIDFIEGEPISFAIRGGTTKIRRSCFN